MTDIQDLRQRLLRKIQETQSRWWEINRTLFDHPELSNEEFESCKLLASAAERESFKVSFGQSGLPTAFRAELKGSSPGPTVAFLAEYDALPGIGHGCGHNFIGTCGTFAAIAFADIVRELPGRVVLLGTPAEETFGGKIAMLEQGEFDDVDFALMIHPSIETTGHYKSVACYPLEIEFHGKTAHASAAPWKGINALDALIQTFVAIDGLKRQLRPTVRVPGIITYGGDRANIIPDRAVGQWSLRAESVEELHLLLEKVLN
ncbi:MAG: amidohydrolase, partial [bacterium]